MFDNMRGNIRMVEVYGFETEIGSVYAHDIVAYMPKSVGGWIVIPMADRSAHLVNVIRSTLV